jgi:DNA gyrase subunit A
VDRTPDDQISDTPVIEELRNSFLEYSMSVIVSRALPDVRDGLKPVHRRILYAMWEAGFRSDRPYRKSATTIGDTMGKYHPHGDCLDGDTRIVALDGSRPTLRDLTEQGVGQLDVLSVGADGQLTAGQAHSFRVGQMAATLFHVTLSNGATVTATGNHPFLTDAGVWVRAEDLEVGARLRSGAINGDQVRCGTGGARLSNQTAEGTPGGAVVVTSGLDTAQIVEREALITEFLDVNSEVTADDLVDFTETATVAVLEADGYGPVEVAGVDVEQLAEPIAMYDFTVDDVENLFISTGEQATGESIVCVHNSAIYDTLVRMAQPWALRVPLVDGHGNFGSLDDGPAAARYCLAGAHLRLADGTSPLLDTLVGADANSEADIDLKVLGRDSTCAPVRASRFFHSGQHPTLRLRTDEGYEVTGTGNHPVLCLESIVGVPLLQWRTLDEITPGTVVVISKQRAQAPHQDHPDTVRMAMLAGARVAEGWYGEGRAGFDNTDVAFFDTVACAYDDLVKGRWYRRARTLDSGKPIHEIDVQDTEALNRAALAKMRGQHSWDKRVPEFVWASGPDAKQAFLQALFEGGGSVRGEARNSVQITYSTRSERLAVDIQTLLLEFGVVSRRTFTEAVGEHKVNISNRHDARRFATHVGFFGTKQRRLEQILAGLPGSDSGRNNDRVPFVSAYLRDETRARGVDRKWLHKHRLDSMSKWADDGGAAIRARLCNDEAFSVVAPLMNPDWHYTVVASVADAGERDVFSVKVDSDDHTFLADGFVNHNTEARLSPAGEALLADVEEETVDMVDNFDAQHKEPSVLPCAFPNLLVNGTAGIAVGMATNIPPHNLGEVTEAAKHLLMNPDATVEDLMRFVPGPDLPTGGQIVGLDMVRDGYHTGRGTFRMRATATVADVSARRRGIVVTELPYMVGPERIIAKIKELVNQKRLNGISDVKDLSGRGVGTKLVIECKTGFNPAAVLEDLYRLTPLEESFGINALALVDSQPRTLSLRDLLFHYVEHRLDIVRRRTRYRLRKAEARAHIVEGLLTALNAIDEVVATIRSSRTTDAAKTKLMKQFSLSEVQAAHILEMPLRRLVGLEVTKLKDELRELKATIKDLKDILGSDARQREVVSFELDRAAEAYGSPRRTVLLDAVPETAGIPLEVEDDPCEVILTANGLIGRLPAGDEGHKKRRGKTTRADLVVASVASTVRASVAGITSRGRWLRVTCLDLPDLAGVGGKAKVRGGPVREFFGLEGDETVVALLGADPTGVESLALATSGGVVKRLAVDGWPTKDGQEVISLKDDDSLVAAVPLARGDEDIVLVSDAGQLLRIQGSSARAQGRTAGGVAGMKLPDGASVIAMGVIASDAGDTASDPAVVTVTRTDGPAAQSAKRSAAGIYPTKGRGGGGVRCHTLRKGEAGLVAAWIGVGEPWGAGDTGDAHQMPTNLQRRDASGERLDGPVTVIGFPRH